MALQTTPDLAEWVSRVQPSPTAASEAKVAERLEQGLPVYRLGLGEPDFPTPDHVKAAAIEAIRTDFTGYTATAGTPSLRRAIVERLRQDIGVAYGPEEVLASVGGKQALYNAVRSLCRMGDEVLIPVPYWVSFPEQVRLAGGTPVFVPAPASDGYKVTPRALEQHVSSRTRLLILNSPNNPSGAVYGPAELAALAAFCQHHDLWVISDEVYAAFTYTPGGHVSIASLPGMRERTVVVNAVSKTYGMTGWRLGYAAAPRPLADAMITLQSHVTSNPTSIAQKAAEAALTGPQDGVARARAEYDRRRCRLAEGVGRLRGMECGIPDGAFYLWVDVSAWCGRELAGRQIASADDLADVLLDEEAIAVVPGTGFGSAQHLRLSFAAPPAELEIGIERMEHLIGTKS